MSDFCNTNQTTDSNEPINFYEREFYVLSNFSSFNLVWCDITFPTSEHAYQWEKFKSNNKVKELIRNAKSAHEAYTIAQQYKSSRDTNWDLIKVTIMTRILKTKLEQHEYVRKKLAQTGDRLLQEKSWRDNFWGTGPNGDGQNQLGKIWMQIRDSSIKVGQIWITKQHNLDLQLTTDKFVVIDIDNYIVNEKGLGCKAISCRNIETGVIYHMLKDTWNDKMLLY